MLSEPIPQHAMKIALRLSALAVAASLIFSASAPGQIVYDSVTTTGSDGNFSTAVPHYLQVVTLALPNGPVNVTGLPQLGIRWNATPAANQLLTLNFWTGIDTSPGASNVLGTATLAGTISFPLAPLAVGSYFYSINGLNVNLPSSSFAVEVAFFDDTGTALSTALGGRLSTGSPVAGSNDGFVYSDFDGTFEGSERVQINGLSGNPAPTNYRMQITAAAVAVPEPGGVAFAVGALVTGWIAYRRRKA